MSLKRLLNQGKLRNHKTSKEEIINLLKITERDISDAKVEGISSDRKFAIAYNAILQLATIPLYCKGYETQGIGHHFTVFQAMKEIMGRDHYDLADYFDSCRAKRNITDYMHTGEISDKEAKELIKEAERFFKIVVNWFEIHYPNLLGDKGF
ncbi:MAG: hypothetical protein AUJ85_10155 [Elusimicrobia bacterium CG1_02_37_114]|nr:MAG: hypothetical protein AUJ85_10155 [Elusimicrobia bacterium CG1_02_37_114]PIV53695.1 MAG: hypothetical protein COS17_02565 [Elusimicrobia bacterium CG02_land_8_20_14_3_00_37_13]